MLVLDQAGDLVPEESVTLYDIYCVKALPVPGEYYEDGNSKEGLWSLEIQDMRGVFLMRHPPRNQINHLLPPYTEAVFDPKTNNPETDAPFTMRELCNELTLGIEWLVVMPADIEASVPCDIDVRGVPVPVAVDLIVSNMYANYGVKFDPSEDTLIKKLRLVPLDKDVSPLLFEMQKYRLFGGKGIIFPAPNMARTYVVIPEYPYSKSGTQFYNPNHRSAVPVPFESTGFAEGYDIYAIGLTVVFASVPIPNSPPPLRLSPTMAANRARNPYRGIYRGFLNKFISQEYPFSLVTFDWAEFPTTHVHLSSTTPIRSILEGPHWRFVKDLPTRVQYNGNIQVFRRFDSLILVRITECMLDTGYAKAIPLTGDPGATVTLSSSELLRIYIGKDSWWRAGDEVWVMAGSMTSAKWVAVAGRYGPKFWQPPSEGDLAPGQQDPPEDVYCQDTIPPEPPE